MRDRLIELLNDVENNIMQYPVGCFIEALADRLIAGGIIVPPCKQNDVLWMHCAHRAEVHNFRVTDVSWLNGVGIVNTDTMGQFLWEDVGKTVFLTREAAERALKERSDANV